MKKKDTEYGSKVNLVSNMGKNEDREPDDGGKDFGKDQRDLDAEKQLIYSE